jgi:predicted house-cleaning noncanonical NTP pyrophosphatase (MazG superfamily)
MSEKLVRDKIIDFSRAKQDGRRFRVALDSEMSGLLARKLVEEALEVGEASNRSHMIEELADVTEVLDAIRQNAGISAQEVLDAQRQKAEKKGAFRLKVVLDLDTNIELGK